MKNNRIAAVLLCLILAGSQAACCSGESASSAPPASPSAEASAGSPSQSPKAEEPVAIKWLAYQTLAQPNPEAEILRSAEELFNADFEFMFVDDNNWDEALNVKLAAGEIPDVMRVNDRTMLGKYIEQGVAAELPLSELEEKAPNYIEVVNRYDPSGATIKSMMYDGKNYGFSNINLDRTYGLPIMWNQDWLNAAGIEKIPATIEEYAAAMDQFRNNDPDKNGAKDTYGMSDSMFKNIYAAYGLTSVPGKHTNMCALKEEENKIVFSCVSDRAKEVLTLLADWYAKGYIDPEYITGENRGGYTHLSLAYTSGKIGVSGLGYFYHWAPSEDETVFKEMKANGLDVNYVAGTPIIGPYGDVGATQRSIEANSVMITSVGMKNDRIRDTVLAMLNKMYSSDEAYAMLNTNGVEGIHWKRNEKGEVVSLNEVAADARRDGIQVLTFASTNPDFAKTYKPSMYQDWGDQYFQYQGLMVPFINPTKEYADANTQYLQDLDKLTTETFTAIITGAQSVDTFDTYREAFLKNGGQAIMDAATRANFS